MTFLILSQTKTNVSCKDGYNQKHFLFTFGPTVTRLPVQPEEKHTNDKLLLRKKILKCLKITKNKFSLISNDSLIEIKIS